MLFSGVARALIYTMMDLKAAYCDSFFICLFSAQPRCSECRCWEEEVVLSFTYISQRRAARDSLSTESDFTFSNQRDLNVSLRPIPSVANAQCVKQ